MPRTRPHAHRPALLALCLAAACQGPPPTPDRLVPSLPVLEFPADSGAALAVVLTGDGGWAELVDEVATRLRGAGVAVVGIDSRRWLGRQRSPEAAGAMLDTLVARYPSAWARSRVVLVGYSRGANLAAFGAARARPATRAALEAVVLLAPGSHEKFRYRRWDNLRRTADPRGTPVPPVVRSLAPLPVWCVSGREEPVPVCRGAEGSEGVRVLLVEGGHFLGRDYDALAAVVLESLAEADGEREGAIPSGQGAGSDRP